MPITSVSTTRIYRPHAYRPTTTQDGTKAIQAPFTILVDTREQLPWSFTGIRADACHHRLPVVVSTIRRGLDAGDYSVDGMERQITVERKTVADLYGTLGSGRRRFLAELGRLATNYQYAAVIIEGDLLEVLNLWPPALDDLAQWLERRASCLPSVEATMGTRMLHWARCLRAVIKRPPPRSSLLPKTIWRSYLAWSQRYPTIHWMACPGREFAERACYRVLERWHRDHCQ